MNFRTMIVRLVAALAFAAAISCYAQQGAGGATSRNPASSASKSADSSVVIPEALPKGKKLILLDGTFQLVREYSVEGDRVRYWSVERSQWEEIPANLVDWNATHKAEAQASAKDAQLKAQIHAANIAREMQDANVDLSLEIKPGLFLPDGVGFYALDANKHLAQMKQSDATAKTDIGREMERIMTGVPMISSRQTLQLPGEHAALRLTSAEPEFYIRPADDREPRFQLLRAHIKAGRRVLELISTNFAGVQSSKGTEIEFQTWTPAAGVYRYTMDQRLEPGEYAFVETTSEGVSAYVWDFGIDAPGNKRKR